MNFVIVRLVTLVIFGEIMILVFLISKMIRKFHKSELSQNNEFYAKSVCLGNLTLSVITKF